jgi:hypothetical protein
MEMQKFFPWHPPGQPNIEAKNLEQGQPPSSKVFSFFRAENLSWKSRETQENQGLPPLGGNPSTYEAGPPGQGKRGER